jgi:hypothetical protein
MKSNTAKQIMFVLLTAIVIALIAVYGHKKTAPAPTVETEKISWPSKEIKKETINESTDAYRINAVYPIAEGDSVTMYFKSFVDEEISIFKQNSEDAVVDGSLLLTLDITYEQKKSIYADNYIFTVTSDTGGAHGLEAHKTFSFNEQGKLLTLADLFTNGTDGLKTVALFIEKELNKRDFADSRWIKEGTTPAEEHYRNFVITDEGITFIFDPYQVAPYAAGTQSVLVPFSAFKTIANQDLLGK